MNYLKDLDNNLDMFNKLIQDIVNCEEIVSEIYKSIILLNSIPHTYKEVKNMIKYGKDTLTPEIVIDSLESKEMEIKAKRHDKKSSEIHMMWGRTQFRQISNAGYQSSSESSSNEGKKWGKSWSRSKSRIRVKKCYVYRKAGYFIKDCYKDKSKQKVKERDEVNVLSSASDVDDSEVYMITSPIAYTAELNLTTNSCIHERILDSNASFHVTSEKDLFGNLRESKGRHVVLCDNFSYTITGIGDITIKFDTTLYTP